MELQRQSPNLELEQSAAYGARVLEEKMPMIARDEVGSGTVNTSKIMVLRNLLQQQPNIVYAASVLMGKMLDDARGKKERKGASITRKMASIGKKEPQPMVRSRQTRRGV